MHTARSRRQTSASVSSLPCETRGAASEMQIAIADQPNRLGICPPKARVKIRVNTA